MLPISPSGDNVFKYLATLCIALIAFNLLYPREKSLEIKQLISSHQYEVDLLEIKVAPVKLEQKTLENLKYKLDSVKSIVGSYPIKERKYYDSLYSEFGIHVDELNSSEAEIDHKNRLISNLNTQLKYYEKISYWTFLPSIILLGVSFIFWIISQNKESKKKS